MRLLRRLKNISQAQLAKGVGVTFQQVQKYENGANRISASKLYQFAQILEAPVSWFFEGLETPTETTPENEAVIAHANLIRQLAATVEGVRLAAAYTQLSPSMRSRILGLAEALVEDEDETS